MKTTLNCMTIAVLLLVMACYSCSSPEKKQTSANYTHSPDTIIPDSVDFSFVFMGCNRISAGDVNDSNTNASTANLPQLKRTFTEVCQLKPKPTFFFFLGDLVLGLKNNTAILKNQLEAWVKQYSDTTFSPISTSGIQMVAVPGNHEMLYMQDPANHTEALWPQALPTWMTVMSGFVPGAKLNQAPGALNKMTYSFDYNGTHFILMNTDSYRKDSMSTPTIGCVPTDWVTADIRTAHNKGAKHIFLLGHKPAYVDAIVQNPAERLDYKTAMSIWDSMETYHAEAMLSAHSHQYYRVQPHPNKSYQIIAGNAGSIYEDFVCPDHQYYGYTVVYVMKNGKVIINSMGRNMAYNNYLGSLPDSVKTTLRDAQDISWGTTVAPWTNDSCKNKK